LSEIIIEHSNTLREALRNPINLFLGAGFSVHARNFVGKQLPAGDELRDKLVDDFQLPALAKLPLAKICTILEATRKDQLEDYLVNTFRVDSFDPAYLVLNELPISAIFTTNIDTLVPQIFCNSENRYLNDIVRSGPSYSDKTAIDYVALHGSITHTEGFTFNPVTIASSFSSDPDRWHFLTQRLQKAPTVFCGYGLEDAGVLEALNPLTIGGRELKSKWILVKDHDEATEAFYRALGFNIIIGDILDLLRWLRDNIPLIDNIRQDSSVSKHPALVDYVIPNPKTVPVRPIRDFYSGAPATWDDIFSNRIFKTSHFKAVTDAILGKRNVIVVGMFACGKSTLMMQVAAEIPFKGIKLVCSSITIEKAELIVRALNGTKAIIFLDDFSDSVETFNYFISQPSLQIVGFERTYSFDAISHLVKGSSFQIYDCTDLNAQDLQGLYNAIPKELRKDRLVVPKIANRLPPALFEVVESNMVRPHIMKRFAPMLKELEAKSIIEHDFLTFCCYVHECRTSVSFDMAMAFLRHDIKNYSEVYDLVKRLNSLVVSSYDLTVDSEQDHFMPRSTIISMAVLANVRADAFRRVLERFQTEVSRFRIVRFDVFRRKAFDEEFATKAFPNWEDGAKYYEILVAKDPSPFLYQQAALYLSGKKRYREAFRWIDQAIEMSAGRIPSIRNSHAVILFRANIDSAGSGSATVYNTLKRSMDILAECYKYDKRKNYHAIKFGEQAIEFWQAYGDQIARGYLASAKKWLTEERMKSPWNRRIGQLVSEVIATLDAAS
jgi:tetratricopeptide (TPR) repeat protein